MKAIIIAGGLGTRLRPLTEKVPKPMLDYKGKPLLEHLIEELKRNGILEIILCTGYFSEKIEQYFGDGSKFGLKILYSKEESELGTGGALKLASKFLKEDETFLVVYGDLYLKMDLKNFIKFHKQKNSEGTLTIHQTDHPHDSDLVKVDHDGKITDFFLKNTSRNDKDAGNLGNAGVYCFNSSILNFFPDGRCGLDKDVLPRALLKGAKLYGYITNERILDIGTHDRYKQ